MEKWKIGVIAVLILGLGGYGLMQQQADSATVTNTGTGSKSGGAAAKENENKAAGFIGHTLGDGTLPAWPGLGPWMNTSKPVTQPMLKGKPALIEFFRIKCPHCQDAAPLLEALYQRYHPRGLQMLAIQTPGNYKDLENEETKWPSVQSWVKATGLTYPIAFDKDSAYFQGKIGGQWYPTTLITDASGKVVYGSTGHDTDKAVALAVEIEKLFPGPGTLQQRAAALSKLLQPFVIGADAGPDASDMVQSLNKDVLERLQK